MVLGQHVRCYLEQSIVNYFWHRIYASSAFSPISDSSPHIPRSIFNCRFVFLNAQFDILHLTITLKTIAMSQPREYPVLPRESTLANLPAEYPTDAQDQITKILTTEPINRLVVLDDDPTGTQTCHDISVLAVWDIPTLTAEFQTSKPGFFILTNSRALPPDEAEQLIHEICTNVAQAANATNQKVDIVLRGDSTLRGHFPLEPDVAQKVFGPADALVLAPFFFQGGRFTIDDVHYVAEGESLVPAGATQFAKDATFGYKSSNLRDYVLEKAPGRFSKDQLHSVTIEEIRTGGPQAVCEKLLATPKGGVVIANAAAESDMHVFVAGLLLGMFEQTAC